MRRYFDNSDVHALKVGNRAGGASSAHFATLISESRRQLRRLGFRGLVGSACTAQQHTTRTAQKASPARAALASPCMTRNTAARCRVMLDTRAAVKSRYGVPALARAPSLHMRHGHACCRWRSCSDLARPSRALGMPQPPHRSRALRACMQRIACLQRSSPVQVHCALAFALSTPCSRPRPHAIYLHVHPRRSHGALPPATLLRSNHHNTQWN